MNNYHRTYCIDLSQKEIKKIFQLLLFPVIRNKRKQLSRGEKFV